MAVLNMLNMRNGVGRNMLYGDMLNGGMLNGDGWMDGWMDSQAKLDSAEQVHPSHGVCRGGARMWA
jgi:hypothetical protein